MKAVIYARVSTSGQEEKGTSLESQVQACTEYALANGYSVERMVKETFSGAYLFERPQICTVRDEVKQGRYDAVISYSIDRVSRDFAHLIILSNECDRYNTKLLFVTEGFDNTAEGKLLQSVKGYVAEVERQKIRERTMRGVRTKAERRELVTGYRIFGYQWDAERKVRSIAENEAEIVRWLFAETLAGRSMRSLAMELDAKGISPARDGACWSQTAVGYMLRNPSYIGKTYAFRHRLLRANKAGRQVAYNIKRDISEWVLQADNLTPAVISEPVFNQAQRIIKENQVHKRRTPSADFLLLGRVICEACGRTYTVGSDKKTGYRAYRCNSRQSHITNCGNRAVGAPRIEPPIWAEVVKILENPAVIAKQLQTAAKLFEKRTTKQPDVRHQIRKLENEVRQMASRAGGASDAVWGALQIQIDTKHAELTRLKETQSRPEVISQKNIRIDDIKRFCSKIKGKLNSLSLPDKIKVLNALDAKVLWNGQRARLRIAADQMVVSRKDDFTRPLNRTIVSFDIVINNIKKERMTKK